MRNLDFHSMSCPCRMRTETSSSNDRLKTWCSSCYICFFLFAIFNISMVSYYVLIRNTAGSGRQPFQQLQFAFRSPMRNSNNLYVLFYFGKMWTNKFHATILLLKHVWFEFLSLPYIQVRMQSFTTHIWDLFLLGCG